MHLDHVDSEEQERIDDSKFYYFGLIFKHFNSFEEKTKNTLLKIYFYRLLDGKKFKEPSTKPYFGPLTKEEYRNGMKHPQSPESNPLTNLLKYSLRDVAKEEHDCIYEFVKILNSKAKLNLEISHMLLRICINNDEYEDVLKEAFDTTFKIPSVKKSIMKPTKEWKPEICILLCALLEQSRTSEDSKKVQVSGRKSTHRVIIKSLLELPKHRMSLTNEDSSSITQKKFVLDE